MLQRRLLIVLSVVTTIQAEADFRLQEERPVIRAPQVREASGLAASVRDPSKLWVINDSGSSPALHLVGRDGADFGSIELAGAANIDWEDLASFTLDGKPWLLVADIGDNQAAHRERVLYLLEEPEFPKAGGRLSGGVSIKHEIRFCYQGGPRDCEAVAVDAVGRKILLVSKRTDPPEIHELPLEPPVTPGVRTTKRVGEVRVETPAGSLVPFRNQPTAMDIAPDGSRAAILTYYGVFLFERKPGEDWSVAFSRKPAILALHLLPQAEALAFGEGAATIHVLTEGKNPRLVSYRRRQGNGRP